MKADASSEVRASQIDLATTPDFDLGGLRVRPARRQIRLSDGSCHELEPRVMQVLVALASLRSDVVSRDRLIATCWAGRIVGDDSINRCIVALRHLAKSIVPEPFVIETIPRVGYCLVERQPMPTSPALSRWGRLKTLLRPRLTIFSVAVLMVAAAGLALSGQGDRADAAPASLAVLPFRSLSADDPYFAQGLAEEILGQLSREPQFRVAGRTSSGLLGDAADLREVGRRLDVAYVLEGSVGTQGDRIRVYASLIRTSDGMQLWSQSYYGTEDDIFVIQHQIGSAIANALRRRLAQSPPLSGPLVTNGDVYNLYLTARGLLRTRKPAQVKAATDLLRRAVELDPGYAPAWSSLGASLGMMTELEDQDSLQARQQEAVGCIRRALALAPNLAEAHGALGMVLHFRSAEAEAHIRRAAELDPNSAEISFWLGHVHGNAGDFDRQLEAYRRAARIDPLLITANLNGARLAFEMGYRDEAQAWVRRVIEAHPPAGHFVQAEVAFAAGDFSEAVRIWAIEARSRDPDFRSHARQMVDETLGMLGLSNGAWIADGGDGLVQVAMKVPPSPGGWRSRNKNQFVSFINSDRNAVDAKRLLNAGRQQELISFYDSDTGLLGLSARQRPNAKDLVDSAAVVALALRASGRATEADRLLAQASAMIAATMRQGRVPTWFHATAASIWAAQGRQDQALSALERAIYRGWVHAAGTDLPDIADEPAFHPLRGQPRFERVRAKLNAHLERERQETIRPRI